MTSTHKLPPVKEDELYMCPVCEQNGVDSAIVIIEDGIDPIGVCTMCGEMKWSDIVRLGINGLKKIIITKIVE